jgi:transcriptional regulator with XRE-family HTH domain
MSTPLQAVREERQLSRATVATQLGMSERQLQRLERGVTTPKRVHLLALSEIYDVPVSQLEDGQGVAA